jgi:hypothetical protein
MKAILGLAVMLALAGCTTVTMEQLAAQCDAYGFKRGTADHARCVQQEARAYESRQAAFASRLQAAGAAMQAADSAGLSRPSVSTASKATGPLVRESVSGMNRICVYNVMGSASVRTIPSTQLCPQWGN